MDFVMIEPYMTVSKSVFERYARTQVPEVMTIYRLMGEEHADLVRMVHAFTGHKLERIGACNGSATDCVDRIQHRFENRIIPGERCEQSVTMQDVDFLFRLPFHSMQYCLAIGIHKRGDYEENANELHFTDFVSSFHPPRSGRLLLSAPYKLMKD